MLKNGVAVPAFCLKDQDGVDHDISTRLGKAVILLFFRGRFCPTTRKSLPAWQDFTRSLDDLGIELLAVSYDTQENHRFLKEQYSLTFPLLSDPDLVVSRQFGIYESYAETRGHFGEPALVIVDSEGKVAYSIISSGPKGLPEPGSVAGILIFMSKRGGIY